MMAIMWGLILFFPTTSGKSGFSREDDNSSTPLEKVAPKRVPGETSFADFRVVIEPDEKDLELDVKGSFTLGAASDGINLFKEKTAITVGPMSTVIPPDSFKQGSKGKIEFQKLVECTYWDLFIRAMGKDTFEFHLELQGAKDPGKIKANDVSLVIGNDSGKAKPAG